MVNWKGTLQISWLKYGRNNQYTGVQHLDIFGVLIEVAVAVETAVATRRIVIVIVGQWKLGH
jgi:hypothetical protein